MGLDIELTYKKKLIIPADIAQNFINKLNFYIFECENNTVKISFNARKYSRLPLHKFGFTLNKIISKNKLKNIKLILENEINMYEKINMSIKDNKYYKKYVEIINEVENMIENFDCNKVKYFDLILNAKRLLDEILCEDLYELIVISEQIHDLMKYEIFDITSDLLNNAIKLRDDFIYKIDNDFIWSDVKDLYEIVKFCADHDMGFLPSY